MWRDLGNLAAYTVAFAFGMTGLFKAWHPASFRHALDRAVGRHLSVLWPVVPTLELAAAVAILIPRSRTIGLVAALVLLVAFTSVLRQVTATGSGCGCWVDTAAATPWPYVWRNVVLLVLCGVGLAAPTAPVSASSIALGAMALLFALVIMELPAVPEFIVEFGEQL